MFLVLYLRDIIIKFKIILLSNLLIKKITTTNYVVRCLDVTIPP